MRFLVDECTGSKVAHWLGEEGHEVFSVFDEARGLSDKQILEKAVAEDWLLVTNDKDFGEKIFREKIPHKGIILIRLDDERAEIKIKVLQRLLSTFGGSLKNQFIVVTEKSVRVARQ